MPVNKNHHRETYRKRFDKVFDYIERHLDEALLLEQLSEVAHFSPYHFHRQFSAWCGIPPGRYIQLMRLKRASYRLAFNPHEKIIEIALDAGFQHAESFSRAFKQVFDVTPSEFRQQPVWITWHQRMPQPPVKRRESMSVEIKMFPITPVAMLTHHGDPQRINETAARFIAWRKTSGASPVRSSQTFGIAPHDPASTPAADFQYHLCGSVTAPINEDNAFGVVNSTIPGGRCAVLRHHGSHSTLTELARSLYSEWLPASGEELRDFPLFFHYHNFVHEVAEHELLTDIYLPLK
ncbi:AraC family transcriptional regulator [Pantoea dispersa]|uniref:AraC family transcriptional regulator n=1 Tax=Pantoea dispersa TaxID=59814 RepID=UPI001CA61904|nr:AraC family transcriptional regulator [Pantoea dispersa]QZY95440.1 AraC family transcriptional regulator [Pantoea dispersa]